MNPTMKRMLVTLVALATLPTIFCAKPPKADKKPTALILLGEWFGDTYFPLKEKLEGWGWTLVKAGVDTTYRGCYNKARDVQLRTDVFIPDLTDFSDYDCLIIPSGPQFRKFKTNEEVLQFIRDAHEAGLVVASLCTGNFLVNEAGLAEVDHPMGLADPVTRVGESILMGKRGGGPPPGNGFEGAPIDALCEAIARELGLPVSDKKDG